MKKRIIIFFSMALLLSFGVNAQTLSTDTFNTANANLPAVGSNFNVPVDAASIGDVFTLTVFVEYDNTILSYTGSTNAIANTIVTEQTSSVIKILIGDFPNQSTIADGKLVDLQFDFLGGETDLTFHTSNYGSYKSNILLITYLPFDFSNADVTNGAVDGDFYAATISGGDWDTGSNWTTGTVPNTWANVTVASGTETTSGAAASANSLTIEQGGQLSSTSTLDVAGDFTIESNASGSGSFIDNGTLTVSGATSADCYVTSGQWHGLAAPVSGETFNSMWGTGYLVWVKEYDEAANDYSFITDLATPIGDMKGWMTWIETGAPAQTFNFAGPFRNGTVAGTIEHAALGHNFVGNPYTSAIDWEAATGWTKTNLYDAIYVYNNGNWAEYVGGVGANGGTQYIAMSQGFFVQVSSGTGALEMTNDVCVHNGVSYLKSQEDIGQIIRLELTDGDLTDESVIRFIDGATSEYDGNFDANKFFSFNADYPQIYSTANDLMAINSLPMDAKEGVVAMDVRGVDGNSMTISVTEAVDFEKLYLKDEFTEDIVNLKEESYTFTYDADITDRFTILFGITGLEEESVISKDLAKVYASDQNINIVLEDVNQANISVFNILGQTVVTTYTNDKLTRIPVTKSGYYFVQVTNGERSSTKKVFIK